jgi:hypothetical protein
MDFNFLAALLQGCGTNGFLPNERITHECVTQSGRGMLRSEHLPRKSRHWSLARAPVAYFLGSESSTWTLSVLVVAEA